MQAYYGSKVIVNMVKVTCPLPDCDFETEDLDATVVVVVLQIHASTHQSGNPVRGPKLDRPRINTGANQEEWNTFLRRWENFRVGSNIPDDVASVQLL